MSIAAATRAAVCAVIIPHWWVFPAFLTLAVSAALLFAPYPPLQDYAEWVYQGALLARLVLGLSVPDTALVSNPVPNSLAQAILGLFSLLLPPTTAAQVFLLGLLGASVALALALARQRQPAAAGAFAVVLLVSFFCNTTFWNGYVNYQLALLIFAAWFLLPPAQRVEAVPILCFGLLIFLSHAAVLAAFCVVIGIRAVLHRRLRGTVLGLSPVLLLGAWYILAEDAQQTQPPPTVGIGAFLAYKAYTVAKLGPYHNFVFVNGGDETLRPALYWTGTAVNLVYVAGLSMALGFGLWRGWRRRVMSTSLMLAGLLLLVMFLLLPRMAQHIINPGERLMIPGVMVLMLTVPLPAAALRPIAVLGGMALAANLLIFTLPSRDWGAPVHFRDMEVMGGARTLFRHRPTSFACKWAELRNSQANGEAPRLPISFRTSLLKTTAPEFDCPAPEGG